MMRTITPGKTPGQGTVIAKLQAIFSFRSHKQKTTLDVFFSTFSPSLLTHIQLD